MPACICLVLLLTILDGCSTGSRQNELRIGILSDVSSAPIEIAQWREYFGEEGVAVTLVKFSSAADRDSALTAGEIDGAVSDVLAAALLISGGIDVKITSRTEGRYLLVAAGQSGVTSVAGLRGKTVALSPNTIIDYCADLMLSASGLTFKDVEPLTVRQIPVRLEMLRTGKTDSAGLPDPLASAAVADGAKVLASSDSLGLDVSVLLFTREAIDLRRDKIAAFYRACDKAYAYINSNQPEVMEYLTDSGFFPANTGISVLPEYLPTAMISKTSFDTCVKWMQSRGILTREISFENAADLMFVN